MRSFFVKSLKLFLFSLFFISEVEAKVCQGENCSKDAQSHVCGNAKCEPDCGENTETCPADCGASGSCGDGVCSDSLGENSETCPTDCGADGSCGDGICSSDLGESSSTCPADCGEDAYCGDGVCSSALGENQNNCAANQQYTYNGVTNWGDCMVMSTPTPTPVVCDYDGVCELSRGETSLNCSSDCPPDCGNGVCNCPPETATNCPIDCANTTTTTSTTVPTTSTTSSTSTTSTSISTSTTSTSTTTSTTTTTIAPVCNVYKVDTIIKPLDSDVASTTINPAFTTSVALSYQQIDLECYKDSVNSVLAASTVTSGFSGYADEFAILALTGVSSNLLFFGKNANKLNMGEIAAEAECHSYIVISGLPMCLSSTYYFDDQCNPVSEKEAKDLCGNDFAGQALLVGDYSTPISLVWENGYDINSEESLVNFPLEEGIDSQRQWAWKGSSQSPLLVYDPEQKGEIKSAQQLFGRWTFGGQKVAV